MREAGLQVMGECSWMGPPFLSTNAKDCHQSIEIDLNDGLMNAAASPLLQRFRRRHRRLAASIETHHGALQLLRVVTLSGRCTSMGMRRNLMEPSPHAPAQAQRR